MRIFVFEFITGGGWFLIDPENAPEGSLLREGRAMAAAVAEDFAAIGRAHVLQLIDARLDGQQPSVGESILVHGADELTERFNDASANADLTLVVAPEFDSHLANFAQRVLEAGGRLLSPSPEFIHLTSDKHRAAQWLANARVPAPTGLLLSPGRPVPGDFPFPAVLKPLDGAGSLDVQRIDDVARLAASEIATTMRLEPFHPGTPVSVAAICGRHGLSWLPPCLQRLSTDGRFTYLGGECPIKTALAKRAKHLAERALNAFPRATGYVGLDLVLGEDPTGSDDVVIEINPRLTTSYVGLRRLIVRNLAETMIEALQDRAGDLPCRPGRVEFAADGDVQFFAK